MVAASVQAVYATGLLELADQRSRRAAVVDDSRALAEALAQRPELIALADSPRLSRVQAKQLLRDCFAASLGEEVLRLLLLLVDRNRLREAPAILAEVGRLADRAEGRTEIRIASAAELDQALRERLEGSFREQRGANIVFHYTVDPSLIGGMRAQVGAERVLDATVSRHLHELKQRILAAPVAASWDEQSSEGASA